MSSTLYNSSGNAIPTSGLADILGNFAGMPEDSFSAPSSSRTRQYTPLASTYNPASFATGTGRAPIFFQNQGVPSSPVLTQAGDQEVWQGDGEYIPAPGYTFQPAGPGQTVTGNQLGGTYLSQPGIGAPSTGNFSRDLQALMNTPGVLDAMQALAAGPIGIPSVALGTALGAVTGRPQVNTLGGALRNFVQDRAFKTEEERSRQTETMEGLNRVGEQLGLDRSGIAVEDLPDLSRQQSQFQAVSAPVTGALTALSDLDALNAETEALEAQTAQNLSTLDTLNAAINALSAPTATAAAPAASLAETQADMDARAEAAQEALDAAVAAMEANMATNVATAPTAMADVADVAAETDTTAAAAQADADAAADAADAATAAAAADAASDAGEGEGEAGDAGGGGDAGGDGDSGDGGAGDGGDGGDGGDSGGGGDGDGGGDGGGGGDGDGGYYQGGLVAFAQGGLVPLQGGGKVAVGPGGGLDDLIPTSISGRRAAALSDGEFVIPADVVSMMGDGSSNAGARRLYDLVKQVRQVKTGTQRQAGPLPVGDILKRTVGS